MVDCRTATNASTLAHFRAGRDGVRRRAFRGLDLEARVAALAELERLEIQLETAAANLAEALREEQEEAWRTALDTADAPEPDSIAAVLDDAAAAVTSTETVATALKVRKPKLARLFLDRAHTAQVRIDELRDRLNALY